MLSDAEIRTLAGSTPAPAVTTLALNVDGRERPRRSDWEPHLAALVRRAEDLARATGDPAIVDSVAGDLKAIDERANEGFDRSTTRGVVFYGCSASGMLRTVELPVAVRDQVRVGRTPFVFPLHSARRICDRFVVVLVDRRHTRIFDLEGDTLTEVEDLYEAVPPRVESGGWAQARGQRHSDTLAGRHYDHSADRVRDRLGQLPGAGLLVGGPQRARLQLERRLEAAIAERPSAQVSVRLTAGNAALRTAALAASRRACRDVDLTGLADDLGPTGRAFAGIAATLAEIGLGNVDTLIVSHALVAPGARCPSCAALHLPAPACPRCGGASEPVDDLVESIIDAALAQAATIHVSEPEPLEAFGGFLGRKRYQEP
jgi:Bacterial archaeo-eukaryotic release factor family 10